MGIRPALGFGLGLMIFDSLVVGLLAGLVGTGIYVAYAAFRRRLQKDIE